MKYLLLYEGYLFRFNPRDVEEERKEEKEDLRY